MLPSEEIKNKINIVDLVGEYVPLKKAGVNWRAVCPFHQERTPSFTVSPAKQIWHCFGCGLGGDIFEFIKQIEGVDFPEALQILAPRAGVVLSRPSANYQKEKDAKKALYEINELAAKYYAKVLSDSPAALAARNYLSGRGFKKETIEKWQIGWAPEDFHTFENFIVNKGFQKKEAVAAGLLVEKGGKGGNGTVEFFDRFHGRIMFPLHDAHGRVVGFTGRVLVDKDGIGKYVNSPETPIYHKGELLYGLHFAKTEIRRKNEVIVVEGNVDVITAHEAGFANVVGSSGTALTESQLTNLKRFTDNASFAFDVDEAGVAAARRAVEAALKFGFNVKIVNLPRELGKDPDEIIRKNPSAWEEQISGAQNFLDFYFAKTFAIMDLTSAIGKKQALAELLPLLVLLPDPVDRLHYLQILSAETNVDEAILLEKIKSLSQPTKAASPAVPGARPGKPQREILERRVLGFLLRFGKAVTSSWEDLTAEDFSTSSLQEIYKLVAPGFQQTDFDWKKLAAARPKIATELELLVFAVENELELLGLTDLEEVKRQFLGRLKLETLKQKMKDLAARIARAEAQKAYKEVKTLTGEFYNLTRELAKYHVA